MTQHLSINNLEDLISTSGLGSSLTILEFIDKDSIEDYFEMIYDYENN
jgi:hypothetical protein